MLSCWRSIINVPLVGKLTLILIQLRDVNLFREKIGAYDFILHRRGERTKKKI